MRTKNRLLITISSQYPSSTQWDYAILYSTVPAFSFWFSSSEHVQGRWSRRLLDTKTSPMAGLSYDSLMDPLDTKLWNITVIHRATTGPPLSSTRLALYTLTTLTKLCTICYTHRTEWQIWHLYDDLWQCVSRTMTEWKQNDANLSIPISYSKSANSTLCRLFDFCFHSVIIGHIPVIFASYLVIVRS